MAINNCTFSGNIGKDCEQRWTPAGKPVAQFSLPVKQGFGDHEKTTWITCKMFGTKAEKLPQHLIKGAKVTVVGEFLIEEWEDNQGQKRSMPVLIVNHLDFSSKGSTASTPNQQQSRGPSTSDDQYDERIPF
ncbi:single-stranded DNA-binding protein [Pantoea sp. ACRSB]|uniref:single-stranded DNA-binding protein n=1 Tax=Pantoea sp. ACRSB TaxID=2918207 RepID=UPI002892F449|nr:single-stranded DNA-binding protein [Pantoea sp. ACRSB]MCG7388801.1 single-stranded DNA-binding protein [Pantoea sp. ACRSB]